MINENLMNPVPLHTSKNKWYCKKKTNHGAYVIPLAPLNRILPMVLTVDNTISLTKSIQANIDITGVVVGTATLTGDIAGIYPLEFTNTSNTYKLSVYKISGKELYNVKLRYNNITYQLAYENNRNSFEFTRERLLSPMSCYLFLEIGNNVGTISTDGGLFNKEVDMAPELCSVGADSGTAISSVTGYIERVPDSAATNKRWMSIVVPQKIITGINFTVGIYYLKITFDGTVYYSEPFEWYRNDDARNIIGVAYRRTNPIVTSKNYIPFQYGGQNLSMEMYLPTYEMKPPYKFDSEVDELDGWKYVNKQVSYHQERCEFLCTQYFAEAIRLLWHSNERTVAGVDVDYMESPEIDWSDDNHVCYVTLLFQCDTIVQTNGEATDQVSSSDGTSFNGSFNPSFG